MSNEHVLTLIENPDPVARSRAHSELARRAFDRDDLDAARCHYREAVELDPTDEVSRDALDKLTDEVEKSRGMFRVFSIWS